MGDDLEDTLMAAIRKFCGDATASHVAGGGELKIRIHELRPIVDEVCKPPQVQNVSTQGADQFFGVSAPQWRRAMDALQAFAHADGAVPGKNVVQWFEGRTENFFSTQLKPDAKPVTTHHLDGGRFVSFQIPDETFSVQIEGGLHARSAPDPTHD